MVSLRYLLSLRVNNAWKFQNFSFFTFGVFNGYKYSQPAEEKKEREKKSTLLVGIGTLKNSFLYLEYLFKGSSEKISEKFSGRLPNRTPCGIYPVADIKNKRKHCLKNLATALPSPSAFCSRHLVSRGSCKNNDAPNFSAATSLFLLRNTKPV